MSSEGSPPLDAERIAAIAALGDPVLRNRWITQAYHELAVGLQPLVGADNATWCAFGVWASATAGISIRMEEFPGRLNDLIRSSPQYRAAKSRLGDAALERGLSDALTAVARKVSVAIAQGNLIVFTELAPPLAALVSAVAAPPTAPDVVERGLAHYREAVTEADPVRHAQLVYLANLELVLHEQTRLQQYIADAMDAALGTRIQDHTRRHGLFGSLGHDVEAALAVVQRVGDDAWNHLATEHMMTLAVPDGLLHLGVDVPATPEQPLAPPDLAPPVLPELEDFLARYDRTGGTGVGSAAHDWVQLGDRMNYITSLFRARQHDRVLFSPPFSPTELQAMGRPG